MSDFQHAPGLRRSLLAVAISWAVVSDSGAATIDVIAPCTLVDAIIAANTGGPAGSCSAGSSGADKLVLVANSIYTISSAYGGLVDGASGLPSITSNITIQGNNATIRRFSPNAFRLFHIASTGMLTLDEVTLSDGLASSIGGFNYHGGAIFNRGSLSLNNSTVSGNVSLGDGGGIASFSGNTSLTNTTLSSNTGKIGGGLSHFNGTLTLNGATVSNNTATSYGGGIRSRAATVTASNSDISGNIAATTGGGIISTAADMEINSITLTNTTITNNSAATLGGGILITKGTGTLNSNTISGNSASYGGGLLISTMTTVSLNNSEISNNSATTHGGGLLNNGELNLTGSTISGNTVASPTISNRGGGIANELGVITLRNTTISGNYSGNYGGGLDNLGASTTAILSNSTLSSNSAGVSGGGINNIGGTASIYNSTLSGNSAPMTGGGIQNANAGFVTLSNTIIANSLNGGDCHNFTATLTLSGQNWFGDTSCDGTAQGDPLLGPLADNGGPTLTHALLDGSGAINAGDNSLCAAAPVNNLDQRGMPRPSDGQCEIGAFELKDTGQFFIIPSSGSKTAIINL